MPSSLTQSGTQTFDRTKIVDALNLAILRELSKDPRQSMAALGRKVSLSAPAVAERVRRLQDQGVITSYRLDIDPVAIGLGITAYIRVRPAPGRLKDVADLARGLSEVVECHRVTGDDCFVVKIHIAGVADLDSLLDRFLAFGTTTTSVVQSTPVPPRLPPLPTD